MSYIGTEPAAAYTTTTKQTITGTGVATYTLDYDVASEHDIQVFLNNVRQEGGSGKAYTVSDNQITFASNIASTDDLYVLFTGKAIQTIVPPDGSVTAAKVDSTLHLSTIKDSTGTNNALSIASNGLVTHPQRPIFSARGVATSTSLTGAHANFDYVTSWTTTDIDVGNLLQSGGYAEVPTGFAGIYQITWVSNATTTTNFNSAIIFHYDGSSYTTLAWHYAYNDYNGYSTGTTLFYDLDVGDRIYVGFDDRYGAPSASQNQHNFSMMFVG